MPAYQLNFNAAAKNVLSSFQRRWCSENVHAGDWFSLLKPHIDGYFFYRYLNYIMLPLMSYWLLHVTVYYWRIIYSDWKELITGLLVFGFFKSLNIF